VAGSGKRSVDLSERHAQKPFPVRERDHAILGSGEGAASAWNFRSTLEYTETIPYKGVL
jgi:hypothetical protein